MPGCHLRERGATAQLTQVPDLDGDEEDEEEEEEAPGDINAFVMQIRPLVGPSNVVYSPSPRIAIRYLVLFRSVILLDPEKTRGL